MKNENEKLGMCIKGGLEGQKGNPVDPTDEGVFVSKINSVGAARRDGRLKVHHQNCDCFDSEIFYRQFYFFLE